LHPLREISAATAEDRPASDKSTTIELGLKTDRSDLYLSAIVVGYILWGCAFIYRSSFIVDGVRYFVLFDDEMISMRYAKNLAHGYGLVYNPGGERVEGFTNLAWVLYMAVLHLLPVSLPKMSLLVQLSGVALLALNLVVVARLGELVSGGARRVGLAAAFLSAFYVAINNWGLQGSEVCVLTLLISMAALMAIRCVQSQTSPIPLYLLLGVATLFRMDAFVPALVVLGMLAIVDERRRFQHAVIGTLVLGLFVGAQTAFNQYYYGYPFPNTYYLKLTGFPLLPRLTRGAIATYRFLFEMNPILPAVVIVLISLRRDWRLLLLGLMFCTVLLYNVWIGADFTEAPGGSNRFVAIVMPLFFVLLSCGLDACASLFARAFPEFVLVAKSGAAGVLAILTVLTLITADLPVRNETQSFGFNDYESLPCASLLLLDPPTGVEMNELSVHTALQVQDITDPDARIMVAGAGVVPYFTDRFSTEVLGKTDAVIAHENWKRMRSGADWQSFLPGHFKWDYAYAIGEKKPDLILNLLG
jgi:arabinofuranosyltransferase